MKEEKPFIFAGFGLPTRSCLFCFHNYDDIFLTEGCREKHLALIIRDKSAAPKLIKKSLLESSIQFLITKL